MNIRIILSEDIKNLGKKGEVKAVKMGYAKNFLIPKKLAILATPKNLKILRQELEASQEEKEKLLRELEIVKKTLQEKNIIFEREAKQDDTLFAQVSKTDIYKQLKKIIGEAATDTYKLTKDNIKIEKPIKKIGLFGVTINLGDNLSANLKIEVKQKKPFSKKKKS